MIVLIRKKGVTIPPEISEMDKVIGVEIRDLIIPDFSDNEYIRTAQYIELFNNIMSCYSSDNQYNILIPDGIPDEILGFIIGYNLITCNASDILNRDDLRKLYDQITDINSINNIDEEIRVSDCLEVDHLIWKILKLQGCEFKKYHKYIKELVDRNEVFHLGHYILNGLVALYGMEPPFHDKTTLFINTLRRIKGQWR